MDLDVFDRDDFLEDLEREDLEREDLEREVLDRDDYDRGGLCDFLEVIYLRDDFDLVWDLLLLLEVFPLDLLDLDFLSFLKLTGILLINI